MRKILGILDIGCSEDQGNYVGYASQRLNQKGQLLVVQHFGVQNVNNSI